MNTGRFGAVVAIMRKDLRLFLRDRFFLLVSVLGLVVYVVIFWVLPSTVDETLEIGVHGGDVSAFVPLVNAAGQGLAVQQFDSADALRDAVETQDADILAGLDFPDRFVERIRAGEPTTVRVLLTSAVPDEVRTAMTAFVRELSYVLAGNGFPVAIPNLQDVVVGPDRAGQQVSLRERVRPMLAFFVLLVETLALATLVASEIQQRTVTAIVATPARVSDFLLAKGLFGTTLAFFEAMLVLAATASLGTSPLLLTVTVLLGAVLVTGFGLMAGSTGRDFIGIVFWSMLFLVPLAIPAVSVLFPGTAATWVQVLPSYGLIQAIGLLATYDAGFGEVAGELGALAAWCVVVAGAGWFVLRRKVARL